VSKLPVISGKETVKALSKIGFYIHHQKGSNIVMKKDESPDQSCCTQSQRIEKGYVTGYYKRCWLDRR